MNSRQEISDELKKLSSSIPQVGYPATVPEGYFNALPVQVMDTIKREIPMFTAGIPKATFEVPDGYFNSFAHDITAIAAGKAENLLPKVSDPFMAPPAYFNELPSQVLQVLNEKPETRKLQTQQPSKAYVLPFWKKTSVAAAAVVFFIAGLTIFHKDFRNSRIEAGASQKLAQVSTQAVNEYIAQNIDDFDSDEIASLGSGYPSTIITNHTDISDIKQYLDENNGDSAPANYE